MTARAEKQPQTGLALMREPFLENQISKLPKPTAAQIKAVKDDFKAGVRCDVCGIWHHPKVVHLDYVGHAALTDRLLNCDPAWNWEPLAMSPLGTPLVDPHGGMWIRLTVCGVSRLGYGHAEKGTSNKSPGDVTKELIGDALRNAAMRFGAALDLWHKGQLHADDEPAVDEKPSEEKTRPRDPRAIANSLIGVMAKATDYEAWNTRANSEKFKDAFEWLTANAAPMAGEVRKAIGDAKLRVEPRDDPPPQDGRTYDDEIPY